MRISQALLDELVAHAREEAPNECCGIVAIQHQGSPDGQSARAATVYRTINTAASPLKFEVDGKQLLGLIDTIEADGRELGAIYHSHTRTAPYPSQTDINFAANWPGIEWVIVGLADRAAPEIHSYLIESGRVREVALERD
jgi:[CysO sulfur-carrier protein]-S-L-cysteine hydrolase